MDHSELLSLVEDIGTGNVLDAEMLEGCSVAAHELDDMDEIIMSKQRKDELIKLAVSIRGELELYIDNFPEIDFNKELDDYENKVKEVFNIYHLFSILSCQCKCRNRADNNIQCGGCCRRHLTASKYSIDGNNKYFNTFKIIR